MSRKDEILSALDTALREREPADGQALRAAMAQHQQEQYTAPRHVAPVYRGLALGLPVAAGIAVLALRAPSLPPQELAKPSHELAKSLNESAMFLNDTAKRRNESAKPPHDTAQRLSDSAKPWNESAQSLHEPAKPFRNRAIASRETAKATRPTRPVILRPLGDDLTYLAADGFDTYAHRVAGFVQSDGASLTLQLPEVKGADSFVEVPLPKLASDDPAADRAALRAYQEEKSISDPRLQKRVTLAKKAVAFGDLLDAIAKETGIAISATRAVADDKLTVFCKDKPLRELMRQITEHFGFVWERTGTEPEFVYRLKQPLRNQFLEEELRNKDKNEALLALDREMESLKKYFDLSPEQAREAAEHAQGAEKEKLELMGGIGWGPARLYFGLEGDDQTALQSGKKLYFGPNGREIPKDLTTGALNSLTGHAFIEGDSTSIYSSRQKEGVKGKSPAEVGAQPAMMLSFQHDELGQVSLVAHTGFSQGGGSAMSGVPMAVGVSPSASSPKNAEANAEKKNKPEFQKETVLEGPHRPRTLWKNGKQVQEEAWTSADVLETIHKLSGKDVIGDYFTRLAPHKSEKGSLFEVLSRTCDPLRLRWDEHEGWLTFRSTDFFNMRLKEVPNRLLEKWAALRKKNGRLSPEELRELSRLTDDQLDASTMAEGAKVLYGLDEWSWVAAENIRPIWRFYDSLPTPLRTAMQSSEGLRYSQLSLDGRQKFLQGAYQHHTDLLDKIRQGGVPETFFKTLESTASTRMLLPDPAAKRAPGEVASLFAFVIPTEQGEKLMKKEVGPGGTSIGYQ